MAARIYCDLANIYQRSDQAEKAVDSFLKSIEIARDAKDSKREAATLHELGKFYLRKNRDEVGIQTLEKSLAIARDYDYKEIYANCLGTMGEFYLKNDSTEKAMEYITQSFEICREIGTPYFIETGLCRLGMAQAKNGRFAEAEKNLLEALKISKTMEDEDATTFDLMAIGDLKRKQNLTVDADRYYRQSVELAEKNGHFNLLSVLYDKLYTLHRNINPLSSLEWLEKGIAVDDSLYDVEMHNQIANYQIRFETAEKEREIERQQNIIKWRNIERIIFIAGLVLTVVFLALVWRMLRYRTKRNRILKEMNATKDKFFSIISHDLKNPAIAQRDALSLLLNNSAKWDEQTIHTYYRELLKSADHQVDLLFNLLNWAQLQTGRMTFKPQHFDLSLKLRSDIALIKKMAYSKGIEFEVEMPESVEITGDANMLSTVVRNLLTNAIKFTDKGGKVTLSVIPSPVERATEGLCITVADTGTGMSAEQIQTLFRLDGKQSRLGTAGEQGTGLGLIVCRDLLAKHDAELHIESELGKGSKIWFKL
jgi:signal transduction histidine kinase